MKTETEINNLFTLLNEERALGIHELMIVEGMNHFDAMVKWDSTHAAKVTDRKKFSFIGCDFPACFVPKDEDAAQLFVERVLAAYAMWDERVILRPEWSFTQQAAALQKVMDDDIPLLAPNPGLHMSVIDLRDMKI